ncbi:MAG TPA: zf-HC2 domain-containing protein [Actinomycetota bacterium]|jgi:anti-sigma factor RsiW
MTHPEDLLAEYVDGSLGTTDRAGVDAHLAQCARCRGEVQLATAARGALRAVPEVAAPPDVASRALREAAAAQAEPEGPPRYARLLPIAAAAVLVGLLAITIPRLGDHDRAAPAAQAGGVTGAAEATDGALTPRAADVGTTRDLARLAKTGVPVEQQELDYDDAALRSLVDGAAAQWAGAALPGATRPAALGYAGETTSADSAKATDCVAADVPKPPGAVLVQLIEASYQGEPAYLAVVIEGAKAGQPAQNAVVYIVRKDDCSLVRVAASKI